MEINKVLKMNHIKEKLIEPEIDFIMDMKKYLQLPIYIYGSIFRKDYFPNKSDIDMLIFSDNAESTAKLLVNFLGINLKTSIFKLKSTNQKTYKTKTYWVFKTNYILDVSEYTKTRKWGHLFHYRKNSKKSYGPTLCCPG